jgi:hypothetical protein
VSSKTGQVQFTGNGSGKITLTIGANRASVSLTTAAKHRKKKRPTVIGTASFTLFGSGKTTIHVRLNATGRKLLKQRHGKLTTIAALTFNNGAHSSIHSTLTLKQAKKHR